MDFKEATMQEVKARETAIDVSYSCRMSYLLCIGLNRMPTQNFFNFAKALILEHRTKKTASDAKHHYEQTEKELVALYVLTLTHPERRSSY